MRTSIPAAFAAATSATLDEPAVDRDDHASRPGRGRRRPRRATGRGPPRAGDGTYGITSTPERRRARIRIARPVRPSASKSPKTRTALAALARRGDPRRGRRRRRAGAAGRGGRGRGSREERRELGRVRTPRAASSASRRAARGRARAGVARTRGDGTGSGKTPAEAGLDHVVRMPCGASLRLHRRRHGPRQVARAAAGSCAAVGRPRPCRRSSHSCQTTRSGAALKIEE